MQSMKMLKVRAALEEKLRQKDISSSTLLKQKKNKMHLKPVNGYYFISLRPVTFEQGKCGMTKYFCIVFMIDRKLETRDDFDDDATGIDEIRPELMNGNASLSMSSKLSSLLTMQNKPRVWISPFPHMDFLSSSF